MDNIIFFDFSHTKFKIKIGGFNMKKYLLSLLLFCFFTPGVYAENEKKIEMPGKAIFVMAMNNDILIHTKEDRLENSQATFYSQYPQLEGMDNRRQEKKINNYMKKESKQYKKEMLKIAKLHQKTYNESIPCTFSQNYQVNTLLPHYIAIGVFRYSNIGTDQGIGQQSYINIDLIKNQIIGIEDLFQEKSSYQYRINQVISEEINVRMQRGETFFEGRSGFQGIKENQAFYKDSDENLVIVFNVHEIAPYSSGIIKFTIAKEKLEDLYI